MVKNLENSLVTQETAQALRTADMVNSLTTFNFALELASADEKRRASERTARASRYEELPDTETFMAKMMQVLRGRTQSVR